jgi:isocitrate dehydrogenase kinase/phosphatase
MNLKTSKHNFINEASQTIYDNYKLLINEYLAITQKGKEHFENHTYNELFSDAIKRYELYGTVVQSTIQSLKKIQHDQLDNVVHWRLFKKKYSQLISKRQDIFIAETFFNSITRKVFNTVGFNAEIEYVDFSDYKEVKYREPKVYKTYNVKKISPAILKKILLQFNWKVPFEDLDKGVNDIFDTMAPLIVFEQGGLYVERIEVLKMAFYRNRGAFIIGRIVNKRWQMPFVFPILNKKDSGLIVDTAICTPNGVSKVFSFTRTSFFVDTTKPVELIDFLIELMPHKSLGELYDSIGYYRHGKTILYRDLYRYVNNHNDQFIIAPGIRGMVMAVFTMRHYNFVFKIIKDKFDNPKKVTREQVIQKYREVELADRVGRLVYAHKFEHLEFNKSNFTQELLDHLAEVAKSTVTITKTKVIISHLYLERRMEPLNLYLENATQVEACAALIDYGYAIKEMAKANIFPGDLLLKNFGVTRHGRVIFYDYDEIQKITEVNFRVIPAPRFEHDEFAASPRFSVGINDVFPEEFVDFMVPKGSIGKVFMEVHGNLFEAKYWRSIQKGIEEGKMLEFFAYDEKKRFSTP